MTPVYLAKAPYRVSLLGGGSDLDWFVEQNGCGFSLGYSLNHFSTISLHPLPGSAGQGILNYSTREYYNSATSIIHPLIRSAFGKFPNLPFFELSSYGIASGGSGLGGSSSFLVALLGALSLFSKTRVDKFEIASDAANIEIHDLQLPIGRQDHFTSALGGFSCLKYLPGGIVQKLTLNEYYLSALYRLVDTLILIPTNITRPSDKVLSKLRDNPKSFYQFSQICSLAEKFISYNSTDPIALFDLLNEIISESWQIKRQMSGIMTGELEDFYNVISRNIPNNWIRLIGAGRGGYFLVSLQIPFQDSLKILHDLNIFNCFPASLTNEGLCVELF